MTVETVPLMEEAVSHSSGQNYNKEGLNGLAGTKLQQKKVSFMSIYWTPPMRPNMCMHTHTHTQALWRIRYTEQKAPA